MFHSCGCPAAPGHPDRILRAADCLQPCRPLPVAGGLAIGSRRHQSGVPHGCGDFSRCRSESTGYLPSLCDGEISNGPGVTNPIRSQKVLRQQHRKVRPRLYRVSGLSPPGPAQGTCSHSVILLAFLCDSFFFCDFFFLIESTFLLQLLGRLKPSFSGKLKIEHLIFPLSTSRRITGP